MDAHVGMTSQKVRNCFGFMRTQIIADDMDGSFLGLRSHQIFQKCHELRTGMSSSGLADDLPASSVQRCVQRERAVAVVLKTVSLGPARGKGQNRIQAIQCLDSALFVHTEDCCIQRRLDVKGQ